MKKPLISISFLLITFFANAQYILNIYTEPSNPTVNDSIVVFANVSFPSGGCDNKAQFLSVVAGGFTGHDLHCLGPLSYICNTTDTFPLGFLATGNYTFVYSVDAGYGFPGCTPGIVAGPVDTLHFSVSAVTGINSLKSVNADLFYSNNELHILLKGNRAHCTLYIYSVDGRLIEKALISDGENILSFFHSDGLYIARLDAADFSTSLRFAKSE
jgi:hypothetical protein